MSEFEFLQSVTIGQYLPTGSALHRLDPRAKLVMVTVFLAGTIVTPSLAALLGTLGLVLVLLAAARIPLRYAMRGVRNALPFLLFLAVLQALTVPRLDAGPVLWQWWRVAITLGDLYASALLLTRFVVLVLGLSLFSLSTNTTELTHGVEQILRPLQGIGFPAHELALVAVIALRFVPLLALEAERIAKAQASRGADLGYGRMRVLRRARRTLTLLVPLTVSALRRAETLVMAMEARCYSGGRGRTHLIRLRAQPKDVVTAALALALAALLVATAWIDVDGHLWRLLRWVSAPVQGPSPR